MTVADALLLVAGAIAVLIISIGVGQLIGVKLARRKRPLAPPFEAGSANDSPLTDPRNDRLGYAPFAKHLAQSLLELETPQGFVLAITGAWGTGKTSMLNFIEHSLGDPTATGGHAKVVRFNPWWFTGREDLTRRFFEHLQLAVEGLGIVDSATQAELRLLKEALAEVGAPGIIRSLLTFGTPRERDIPELKQRVAERLARQNERIIIFIDDVDRLTVDEISDVFMLVKAVGDFPNVLYVLAFDQQVVAHALGDIAARDGQTYLEKIVQTSFDLPAPDPIVLRQIFLKDLNTIIRETPEELFEASHWGNVFWDGIAPLLTRPRWIVRLLNAIRVTYPPLLQEVNGVDFIGLETIRVFANDIYHVIRNNPQHFVGEQNRQTFPAVADDPESEFHRAWESELPSAIRPTITALVGRLFPRAEAALHRRGFSSSGVEDEWKRRRRICHPEIFGVYFQLSVPQGSKSRAEMAALVAITGDQKAFSDHLLEAANDVGRGGTSRVRDELEELMTYVEDIPDDAVPTVVRTFFDIGDALLLQRDEGSDFVSFGNDVRMGRVIWSLLRRFPEETRFEYLHDAIAKGRAVAIAEHEATTLAQQHGEFDAEPRPRAERIVNSEHLAVIKTLVVEKIEQAAREGRLAGVPDLGSILYRWKTWGDENHVREWVQALVATDDGFITLIHAFTGEVRSYGMGDRVARVNKRLSLKSVADFMNLERAEERARELARRKDLDPSARETIDLFLSSIEARTSGRDKDFPLDE